MNTLFQDIGYGLRMLLKNKGVTTIAVVALALGIGANTAIFSLIDAVLLRPLPFEQPEELVQVFGTAPELEKTPSSPANFLEWKEQNRVFERIAAYTGQIFTLIGGDAPERLSASRVSADFFDLLGVRPAMGRSFAAEEEELGRNQVVILSHAFWQKHFGGNPRILGQSIVLNDKRYSVIGIMPAGFIFPDPRIQLWTPIAFTPAERAMRDTNFLSVIARLKEGVTLDQASAGMELLVHQQRQQHPELTRSLALKLVTQTEETVGEIRPVLLILLGTVACVLIICVNVANLLLARAAQRHKEIAIRNALGASRTRIIRLLLTESVLLALIGGAVGCFFAFWGIDLLVALKPENLPRLNEVGMDFRVLAFTGGLSLLTGILFGLVPALQVTSPNVSETLKEGDRSGTGGPARHRVRNLLVISEVALSLMLLTGAGLLIRSFARTLAVDPGFRPENVLTVSLALPASRYPDAEKQVAFFQRLLERVRELPGIESVGAATDLPLFGGSSTGFDVEGRPLVTTGQRPVTEYRLVSPDYFRAMGIKLVSGRSFNEQDRADSPGVAIINETLARNFFGHENPIGKRIGLSRPIDWREAVGVVRDVKNYGLTEVVKPECYVPHLQNRHEYLAGVSSWMVLMVHTESEPLGHVAAIKREVQMLDKDQPLSKVSTMNSYVAESVAQRRFNTLLLGLFAAVGMILAAIGIYGVVAYSVAQRTKEIGIRMALGAKRADMLAMILRHSLGLVLIGAAIGVVGSLGATRLLRSLLFGIGTTDLFTYATVIGLLGLTALLASYIPARRAMRVDPIKALRYE